MYSFSGLSPALQNHKIRKSFIVTGALISNAANTLLCVSRAVCTMLILLLPVEGTRVITSACRCIIRTAEAATLAVLTSSETCFLKSLSADLLPPLTKTDIQLGCFEGLNSRTRVSTALWFNVAVLRSNIYVHYKQAGLF